MHLFIPLRYFPLFVLCFVLLIFSPLNEDIKSRVGFFRRPVRSQYSSIRRPASDLSTGQFLKIGGNWSNRDCSSSGTWTSTSTMPKSLPEAIASMISCSVGLAFKTLRGRVGVFALWVSSSLPPSSSHSQRVSTSYPQSLSRCSTASVSALTSL